MKKMGSFAWLSCLLHDAIFADVSKKSKAVIPIYAYAFVLLENCIGYYDMT